MSFFHHFFFFSCSLHCPLDLIPKAKKGRILRCSFLNFLTNASASRKMLSCKQRFQRKILPPSKKKSIRNIFRSPVFFSKRREQFSFREEGHFSQMRASLVLGIGRKANGVVSQKGILSSCLMSVLRGEMPTPTPTWFLDFLKREQRHEQWSPFFPLFLAFFRTIIGVEIPIRILESYPICRPNVRNLLESRHFVHSEASEHS